MKKVLLKKINELTNKEKETILSRAKVDFDSLEKDIRAILGQVKTGGDKAVLELTEKFDKFRPYSLKVTANEMKEAVNAVDPEIADTFKHIIKNLTAYYSKEKPKDWYTQVDVGIESGMIYKPYDRIGVYVPGRKALFPTIVLRICVPARIAGVKEIVLCSPVEQQGNIPSGILLSAHLLGIEEVYKIGGAQAIAAMAYGTETIKPVQKISAVGSAYVTAAQKFLFGVVNVDKLAGPSDGLILVDSSARPEIVAANMLIESEHGPTSGTVALVPSLAFGLKVNEKVEELIAEAPEKQKETFSTSLYEYSAILTYKNLDEAIDFVNDYAPEHLQLTVENHTEIINKLKNVGAIQLGEYTMISSGDFFGGTANALPTGGMAKIFSDVSVYDFLKRISVQHFSEAGFRAICDKAEKLALYQGMYYHAKAIRIRKEI